MSDNNEVAVAAPAEIPMAQPVAEQAPEESHAARTRRPRRSRSAEPEQIGGAVDQVLSQAQQLAEGEVPNEAKSTYQPFRGWKTRTQQPVKYRKFTDDDFGDHGIVAFKFDLPKEPGTGKEQNMPEVVLKLLRDNTVDQNGNATGLKYDNTRKHGKIWLLPNDPEGRALADKIDYHLDTMAHKMESAMQARA